MTAERKAPPPLPAAEKKQYSLREILTILNHAAASNGLEPALLRGLAFTESAFHADAISHVGAKGLCQLMDTTARELGVADSFDPKQNAEGAAKYLVRLLKKWGGDTDRALASYCWGPANVAKCQPAEWPANVKTYVTRVKRRADLERATDAEKPPAPLRCPMCGHAVDADAPEKT
jgi:soluble lytic murein transglycosylase-like protein